MLKTNRLVLSGSMRLVMSNLDILARYNPQMTVLEYVGKVSKLVSNLKADN